MPTPEQQPNIETQAPALEGMPAPSEQGEHFKTVAVRVSEGLHSQLSFIAQLSGTSPSEEIRRAIENRIETAQEDVDLIAHAEKVREQIEREAAARTAAIAWPILAPTWSLDRSPRWCASLTSRNCNQSMRCPQHNTLQRYQSSLLSNAPDKLSLMGQRSCGYPLETAVDGNSGTQRLDPCLQVGFRFAL